MAPTAPDRMPGRAFGEQRRLFQFGPVVHFDWAFSGSSHGDNVPICDQRASREFGRVAGSTSARKKAIVGKSRVEREAECSWLMGRSTLIGRGSVRAGDS